MKYRVALFAWVSMMCYGLLKPGSPWDPGYIIFPGDDKLIHFTLFAGASVLALLVFKYEWQRTLRFRSYLVVVVGTIAAASTEWIQGFVPYRTSDLNDLVFDFIGVVIPVIFHFLYEKRSQSLPN